MYESQGESKEFIHMIEECKSPIFVSSMAYNMSLKSIDEYNDEEMNVYENLNYYDDVDRDILKKLGNIDSVKKIFNEVILKKDETLEEKAASFIPDANRKLESEIISLKQNIEKRINLLSNNDKKQLLNQKKSMYSKINGISSHIENVFGELNIKLEESKKEALAKNILIFPRKQELKLI